MIAFPQVGGRGRNVLSTPGTPHGPEDPHPTHVANALQWLYTLYRNPADLLREHVRKIDDGGMAEWSMALPMSSADSCPRR